MNTDFLLIGGGCGGLETALLLRKLVADATITLVNPQPHLIYRPWLMYLPAQRRRLEDLQISCTKPPPHTGCISLERIQGGCFS
jgi:NADH dehydrogenase FAD-containing subunit